MNTEKLMKKLTTEKSNQYEKIIAEYIIWQLERMSNKELSETTAKEIESGVFTMQKIFGEVQAGARKAAGKAPCVGMMPDEVYKLVRKALKIDEAVPESEAYGFIPSCFSQIAGCCPAPVNPATKQAALDIDLDELF